MNDGFSIAHQWEIHFLVTALAAWPLYCIFRRAGLAPWPLVFLAIPVFGLGIVGSILAFKPWPKVAPRVVPKPARKPARAR
jgi:hypothetical protein